MLDSTTKRKIDTARQILVGKVPDPKSQIDQITLAMIYKFMNDTDKLSVEIGGKPSYFTDDYERFSWDNIIDPRLSGQERMNLYTEGLERMGRNPKLPELFRNIFKNAFLPFRDSNTLNMFLEEINGFEYDHSENLGDAYEYLLSIMSSQGDAGQFRTPRHIIDFIVSVVNPQKHDTILDPACGTAGFLISAIKHIKKENTKDYEGDLLNIDEQQKLADNVVGYDISPDMRRISLVNMFLHNINDPHIYEYDTLSSTDRWEDDFSCILANPPFMSPKGGIKPHERFPIPSTRSEVLFVDYIMEHLTIDGKAGVIVPEGIIFQGQKAFQSLRKKMVDDSFLWAVVSLPSGVFNPYSGVKTSILFFDREIAKKSDEILFVKIEADGYNLGAQRKPIEQNDLPEAYDALTYYKTHLKLPSEDRQLKANGTREIAHTAKKQDITNQDYNLSAGRYVISEIRQGKWPRVKLGEICSFEYGKSLPERIRQPGNIPVLGSNGRTGFHNEFLVKGPTIVIGRKGSSGEVVWEEEDCFPIDTTYFVKVNENKVILKFLYYLLKEINLQQLSGGAGIPGLNRNDAYQLSIPLPPLSVQKEIIVEIESYQKIIDGAKQVVENWKPRIDIDPEWETVRLGDIVDIVSGGTPSSAKLSYWNGKIPWATLVDLPADDYVSLVTKTTRNITEEGLEKSSARIIPTYSVIVSSRATIGRVGINLVPISTNQGFKNLIIKDKTQLSPFFLAYLIKGIKNELEELGTGGTYKEVSKASISSISISLPSISYQKSIVDQIETEKTYVENCKKLIEINQSKIKDIVNRISKV
jgi:type I restriction enzyme M protein